MMQRYLRYDHIDILFETFLRSFCYRSIGGMCVRRASLFFEGDGRVTCRLMLMPEPDTSLYHLVHILDTV